MLQGDCKVRTETMFFVRENASRETSQGGSDRLHRIDIALELSVHSVLPPRFCDMNVPWEKFNCLEK